MNEYFQIWVYQTQSSILFSFFFFFFFHSHHKIYHGSCLALIMTTWRTQYLDWLKFVYLIHIPIWFSAFPLIIYYHRITVTFYIICIIAWKLDSSIFFTTKIQILVENNYLCYSKNRTTNKKFHDNKFHSV